MVLYVIVIEGMAVNPKLMKPNPINGNAHGVRLATPNPYLKISANPFEFIT